MELMQQTERGMKSQKETPAKSYVNVFLIYNNAGIQDNYELGLFSVPADSFLPRVIAHLLHSISCPPN